MTHNTARNWAIILGISSTLALTGCTASPGASTPTGPNATASSAPTRSSGSATSAAPPVAQPATPGATATSGASSGPAAGTGPTASGTSTASGTPSAAGTPAASTAPGRTGTPTAPAPSDRPGNAAALTETYTSPDGTYTADYPATWTAKTDKGYLELTSPDGTITGHVSPKSRYGPDAAWTGRHVTHYSQRTAVVLSDIVNGRVNAYSGYNSAADPAQDSVGWGLSQSGASSLVSMAAAGAQDELWVYFEQSGVNASGEHLDDARTAELTRKAVESGGGATVEAILQSVRITPDVSGDTPPDGHPQVLDRTYTAPDGAFTMRYPSAWTARTDRGYLEITSPTGQTTGRIATTDVRPPTEDWFTASRHMTPGERTPLSDQLGSQVSTYSAYLPDADSPAQDAVLFGLSQVNSSGMVSLPGGGKGRELWVEFTTTPVNTTGRVLTEQEMADALRGTVATHQDVPAVQEMLQSIRFH